MTRFLFLSALPLFFFLILLPASMSAQPYDLRYRLKEGDEYRFRQVEHTSALAQSNDGRRTEIDRRVTRYFTVTFEQGIDGEVQYIAVQDTAIVIDDSEGSAAHGQPDLHNLITRKPIRVRQDLHGHVLSAKALVPLNAEQLLGSGATDAMFARQAAILPVLPAKQLTYGMEWTDAHSDTLFPNKELPDYGRGSGVRLLDKHVTYHVKDGGNVKGYGCLLLEWKSSKLFEEKIIFENLEEFTEDEAITVAALHVATENGLPIKFEQEVEQELTRAIFGDQSSVMPASIRTQTTLEIFFQ
ncbi:MAG: hypothetical protein KFH87_03490 [Bacteroidetes bacterium]|nr:hypothetical protein [Bacteroidota bacterium]